jgi:cardiolipin synthase
LRVANNVGAALVNHRVLSETSSGPLLTATLLLAALAVVAFLWPAWIGWPIGALATWAAVNLGAHAWRLWRRRRRRERQPDAQP